jgi:Ecdysteroid kinase-like family
MIYQTNEPTPTIVLEDVGEQGFDVIEKPVEDFEVSKQIFRRLAKFHAASFFLHHEKVQLSWK